VYCVNWFRKDAEGKFVWPGYGENMRVLKWMIDRIEGRAKGQQTLFGITPQYAEITWAGLAFSPEQFTTVTSIDKGAWEQELHLHTELFDQLAHGLPPALHNTRTALHERLETLAHS
jgi:phosphoenolpyruvate carboxykinase (GTP)